MLIIKDFRQVISLRLGSYKRESSTDCSLSEFSGRIIQRIAVADGCSVLRVPQIDSVGREGLMLQDRKGRISGKVFKDIRELCGVGGGFWCLFINIFTPEE